MHDVGRLVLGCGNFGGIGSAPAFFGQGESEEEAYAIMDAAWDAGIRRFDTADAYGGGRSETWIGRWMRQRGQRPHLTTKVFHSVEGDPDDRGLAPNRIRRQVEGSLDRLGVDRIDLYLTHEPDPQTPLSDTLAAMERLVEQRLVAGFGLSNVDARTLEAALPVACVQNSYSLLDREAEPVLELCAERGVDFEAFGPLAGGWLTGKYRRGEAPPPGSRMTQRPAPYEHLRSDRVFDGLDALAARGPDPATLAFAWLLSDPRMTRVVVGPRRPDHLEPALRALELPLSPGDRDDLAGYFVDSTT